MPEVWEQEGHVRARAFLRGDFQEELKSYASTLGLAKVAGWEEALKVGVQRVLITQRTAPRFIPNRYGLLPSRAVPEPSARCR
jgi:hypothetical protein